MTRLLLSFAIMVGQSSFGQKVNPTKARLLKAFRLIIHQGSKRKVQINFHPWLICNKDGSFYKSDTLYLYDNYQLQSCCEFVLKPDSAFEYRYRGDMVYDTEAGHYTIDSKKTILSYDTVQQTI